MSSNRNHRNWNMPRRDFLYTAGLAASGLAMGPGRLLRSAWGAPEEKPGKSPATVRVAFLYPSTASLREEGYYSWPGSGFDAEGHHEDYARRLEEMGRKLKVNVVIESEALCESAGVDAFIRSVRESQPDGLLLVPFKKSEWASVTRIIDETGIPTIAMASLGILLMPQIKQLHRRTGVYAISSLDNFDAIEYGLNMIRTRRWMKEAKLLSVTGTATSQMIVPEFGTCVQVVPMQRLVDVYAATRITPEVRELARAYAANAKECREPTQEQILDAARADAACRKLIADEQADAVMIQCLHGIREDLIPPPCMGFMTLRDEGIVAGCQNELDSTLTMMLVQQLFNKPGFQQNAACDTESGLYFGAHCTCPSKLNGPDSKPEPYILRNHAEAGVGVVPQVLWPKGQPVTLAHYLAGRLDRKPKMLVYTGHVEECLDTPPAGGCRTNVVLRMCDVDGCSVEGMHQTVFFGHHADQLRSFCQLYDIAATGRQDAG